MGWNKVAIVGVGMLKFGEHFDKSYEAMIGKAYLAVLDGVQKGIDPKDIEAGWIGTCIGSLMGSELISGSMLAGIVGLAGIPVTRIENGCPTGSDTFRNACMGVASGLYDVAIALGVEKMREKTSDEGLLAIGSAGHPVLMRGGTAPAQFAPQATRHMHEFGTTKEQMAMIGVKNHYNGTLCPYSHYQYEITIEDVFKSPMVCWPFNILDCCPQTDGAAAIIICRADLADRYTDKPIYVAGLGMGTDYQFAAEKDSFTEFVASQRAAKQAYKMAGIGPEDIDVAEVHDCFSITEILDYEDLGFCEKGQGGKFIEDGSSRIGGKVAVNPSGGLMAKGHPLGCTGLAQLTELVWQLRGDVIPTQNEKRQVEIKKGYALQHNVGGTGVANSVVTIVTNRKN